MCTTRRPRSPRSVKQLAAAVGVGAVVIGCRRCDDEDRLPSIEEQHRLNVEHAAADGLLLLSPACLSIECVIGDAPTTYD